MLACVSEFCVLPIQIQCLYLSDKDVRHVQTLYLQRKTHEAQKSLRKDMVIAF